MIHGIPADSPISSHRADAKIVHEVNSPKAYLDFDTSLYFINDSRDDVTVIFRNNVPATFEHRASGFNSVHSFSVRMDYNFRTNARIVNAINLLQMQVDNGTALNEEQEIVYQSLSRAWKNHPTLTYHKVSLEWKYSIDTIKNLQYLYCPAVDLLICHGANNIKYPHPYSIEGLATIGYLEQCQNNPVPGVQIEIIDNENAGVEHYVFTAKRLLRMANKRDTSRLSGVYATFAEDKDGRTVVETKHYTFEEAQEALGVYNNQEAAITNGNPELIAKRLSDQSEALVNSLKRDNAVLKEQHSMNETVRQREIDAMAHQYQVETLEYKQRSLRLEAQLEEQQRITASIKAEADRLSAVAAQNKHVLEMRKYERADHYDERSSARKDSSELVKYGPALLLTILSGIGFAMSRGER